MISRPPLFEDWQWDKIRPYAPVKVASREVGRPRVAYWFVTLNVRSQVILTRPSVWPTFLMTVHLCRRKASGVAEQVTATF